MAIRVVLFLLAILLPAAKLPAQDPAPGNEEAAAAEKPQPSPQESLSAYLDARWLTGEEAEEATQTVLARLAEAECCCEEMEALLRAGRHDLKPPPTAGKLALVKGLACEHVDYETAFLLYLPKSSDPAKPAPLLLVGHGGNSAMNVDYATQAALSGLVPWLPVVEEKGIILAAPLSERGWGPIGNSILFSLISWLQRRVNIDPDRIYVTGHSMGGHLSWRSGIFLGDRWGAVAPMSGGYDYVENKEVYLLVNVPGYATFGTQEPYDINPFNKKIAGWMTEHDFDWRIVEKDGGHEIFKDELPKVADFLLDHPRELYRDRVYATAGKSVVYDATWKNDKWPEHTWNPSRPISRGTFHWVRLFAQPEDTPQEQSPQRVWAENLGNNRIRITSEFTRRLRIYLHPKMVDFSAPVEIVANGKTVFGEKVRPDLRTMLELVREFDDRGRIFYAAVDVEIEGDAAVPEPRGARTDHSAE